MAGQDDAGSSSAAPAQMDLDFSVAVERVDSWIDGAVRLLPNLIIALLLFALFYVFGSLARRLIQRHLSHRQRENLGEVLGSLVKWTLVLIGFLLAATIVMPTLKPGDLIAGLGVSSVAIGFAFKDILQNWLAGLLILLRQPFEVDDQIVVGEHEGNVERIETRATIIRTYDGQRVVIPNSDIYTNAVLVKTAYSLRRSEYDVGIGYGDDLDNACKVIVNAVTGVDGVASTPTPEALPWDLAASWVTVRARWWSDSRQTEVRHIRSDVIRAIKLALDEANIDMPFETCVQLLHDQTEEVDGDRGAQREGWPAADGKAPRPRWKAQSDSQPEP
ncbi:mechanosensitive ion channel family protein [Microbulbifer hainanensis]|uniref:mechanosensitive ion channel family protein n=1 Tax=Microbulbifer hainanensis TaxID=2735675 RepID=UPI0018693D61|nr:mechanosensitive ion channel family protein [Microbulbifer hainanensis]